MSQPLFVVCLQYLVHVLYLVSFYVKVKRILDAILGESDFLSITINRYFSYNLIYRARVKLYKSLSLRFYALNDINAYLCIFPFSYDVCQSGRMFLLHESDLYVTFCRSGIFQLYFLSCII